VVGIDLSPDMLSIARARIERIGFQHVTLIQSAVEDAELPAGPDAAFFSLTHDVLQSQAALDNIFRHLRSGARVASFGSKRPSRGAAILAPIVRAVARRYVTTFEGFERPWERLGRRVPDLQVREVGLGVAYVAWGTVPAADHVK